MSKTFIKLFPVTDYDNGLRSIIVTCLLVLFGISNVSSLVNIASGKCPKMDFTLVEWQNFRGTWYEYASYGDYTTRELYKCIKFTFLTNDTDVWANQEFISKLTNGKSYTEYKIEFDGFSDFILETSSGSVQKMWLVDTDYINFTILWTCTEYFVGRYFYTDSSWILTRSRSEYESRDVEKKIDDALAKHSFKRIDYDPVSRDSCPNN